MANRVLSKPWVKILPLLILVTLFFVVKLQSETWVKNWYDNQSFDVLNKIAGCHGTKSLDFYIGEAENALWGPLESVLSGFALLSFSLLYLRRATPFRFGLTVFVYLCLTRPEVLFYPPFGEGITGPFSDIIWLLQNNLDYFGLLRQDTFTTFGPQMYPTALYPLFIAVVMKLIPATKVFLLVLHASYFLMTAVTLAIIREFGLKAFKNEKTALLVPLLILMLPLVQCMIELLNLEIPSLFFTIVAVYYASQSRAIAASLSALVALFVKDPAIIACVAVFIICFMKFFSEGKEKRSTALLWVPAVMMAVAVGKAVMRTWIIGEQKNFNMVCFMCGWQNTSVSIWFYIYLICVAMFGLHYVRYMRLELKKASLRGFIEKSFAFFMKEKPFAFMMFLVTGLWFLLFNNFLTLAYRYQLLMMPSLIFCVGYMLHAAVTKEKILHGILMALIALSSLSSHGLMYSIKHGIPDTNKKECNPTDMERSLEYRNYLKLEMALAKEIEKKYSAFAVIAPFQTAQLLALPQLGYVTKPLDVAVYGMRETLGIKPFNGAHELNLAKTVWVGFPHHAMSMINVPFPIDPKDKILKKIERGHIEVDIFIGGIAIERMRRLIYLIQQGRI